MLMKTTRFLACWGVQIALPQGAKAILLQQRGREFHRCNRCLAGTTLFNSPEVALANELSPEVELLSLDGVAFFEICNGRVVSWASVERPDAEGSSCLISESAECDEVGGFLGVDAEVSKSSNRGNLVSSASISSKGGGG